jgi:hypothetical protein
MDFGIFDHLDRSDLPGALPKLGISRFIVIADNDEDALAVARRAYAVWHHSFDHLFHLCGITPAHPRPADFERLMEIGQGAAGSAQTITESVRSQLAQSGASYFIGQFALAIWLWPNRCARWSCSPNT